MSEIAIASWEYSIEYFNKSDIFELINNNPDEFTNFVKKETLNNLVKLDEFNDKVDERLEQMRKAAASGKSKY